MIRETTYTVYYIPCPKCVYASLNIMSYKPKSMQLNHYLQINASQLSTFTLLTSIHITHKHIHIKPSHTYSTVHSLKK